jgi:rfaE bifunctional protein nucleotidyltransferase chain/domain
VGARIVPDYRDLVPLLRDLRAAGKTLAVANGCFDLLHVGHVRLVVAARAEADLLVLALNSDASARGNKGSDRPVVPLAERMEVVAALAGVDFVTSFAEPTANPLLEALRPDVHVKGTDWTADTVPERDTVARFGGRVVICGDPKTHSSTALAARLRGS